MTGNTTLSPNINPLDNIVITAPTSQNIQSGESGKQGLKGILKITEVISLYERTAQCD